MSKSNSESVDLSALRIQRDDDRESAPAGKIKKLIFAVFAVALLLLVVLFFTLKLNSAATVRVAEAAMVYPSQTDAILTAAGYVVAQRQAAIASKGTGRLVYLGVEEGDAVRKDQIIAQLEHNDVDAALSQAKANLEMANAALQQREAEFNEAELQYQRQKNLLEDALIAQSAFDLAEAGYLSAKAAVSSAKAEIKRARAGVVAAEVDVENTRIRAPFDGTVLTKNADVGEMVAPFAASSNSRGAVVTMADMTSLEVEADVSEANIQRVKGGQSCEIILDAFPDERYAGFVHKIVPTADRAKATVLTKVRFSDRDEKVLPEMSAKVNFLSGTLSEDDAALKPVLAIPLSAVTEANGRKSVFVVKDQSLVQTPIAAGKPFGGQIEILSGVTISEQVVLNPSPDFRTGTRVKIAKN